MEHGAVKETNAQVGRGYLNLQFIHYEKKQL